METEKDKFQLKEIIQKAQDGGWRKEEDINPI